MCWETAFKKWSQSILWPTQHKINTQGGYPLLCLTILPHRNVSGTVQYQLPIKEWSLERNSESCCDIYQNDDWTKQSGFMSSDSPAGRYFQSRGTSWTWPKKYPDSSPGLQHWQLMKRLKLLIYTYWDHFSLSLSIYIYIYNKSCCTPKMNVKCQLYLNKKIHFKKKSF